MSPSRFAVRAVCFLIILLAFSSLLFAQIPQRSNTTSTPVPDAGHNYIKSPIETVNPANGSLSIRIGTKMPPGRGITLPFSFAYDSNGAYYFSTIGAGGVGLKTTTSWASQGGWSYSIPMLSVGRISWTAPGPGDVIEHCHAAVNYVYQDPAGNRHNLFLSVWEGAQVCADADLQNTGESVQVATVGGEGSILATTTLPSSGLVAPVVVTDGSGTVANFPDFGVGDSGAMVNPRTITDRNGNTINLSAPNTWPFNYTDTLGRTAVSISSFASSSDSVSISGMGAPYQINWTSIPAPNLQSNPVNLGPSQYVCNFFTTGGNTRNVISSIVMPNGRQISFTYDPTYATISKITYPNGGYVRYVWGMNSQSEVGQWDASYAPNPPGAQCSYRYDTPAITDRYVSYDGVNEVTHQHFAYSTQWSNPNSNLWWSSKSTTVTTYDLLRGTNFQTVYTYSALFTEIQPNTNDNPTTQIPMEQTVQYYNTNSAPLKTVAKTWLNERVLASVQTNLEDNSASRTNYSYNVNEQETERDEYGFGNGSSGSLARITVTNYASFTPHIVNEPSSIITYDGNVNRVAETDYAYDQSAPQPTSGVVEHQSGTNAGNLTTQTQWLNAGGTSPVTTFSYDDTGQVLSETDPNGNRTTYSYADSFSVGTPPGQTNAFLTRINLPTTSNGVAHIERYSYSYADGRMTTSTDQNNQSTSYLFNDSLDRLTEIDYPDAGQTLVTYNDGGSNPNIVIAKLISSGNYLTTKTVMDGVGQPIQTQLTSDPSGTDYTDTTYDGTGNIYTQSNPYRSTSDPTYGISTSTYDALGRITQLAHPDGTTALTTYYGAATEFCDEGNGTNRVCRITQDDALGRLISVCEVTNTDLIGNGGTHSQCGQSINGSGFLTSYQYDPLGNLLQVNQGTLNPRTFTHDSLSRLLTANNPESGVRSYTYDANGNVSSKTSPTPNQTNPAVTETITYCYDQLNRLVSKSYSAQACPMSAPDATFSYDVSSANGLSNLSYPIGRLVAEANPNAWMVNSYDNMGRITTQWQCGPYSCATGGYYPFWFTYDKIGNLLTHSFSRDLKSTYTLSYTYDNASHLATASSSIVDTTHPGTLLTGTVYDAAGQLTSATLGNGLAEIRTYDNRLRLTSITAGNAYSVSMNYAPNGNVLSSNDSVNGNYVYTYDDFNRMTSSVSTNGNSGCGEVYDRYGNRWQQTGAGGEGCWTQPSVSFSQNNNRIDGFSYDAAGNLLSRQSHSYAYDPENRIVAIDGGSLSQYIYDASGRRVGNTNWTVGTVEYFYDLSDRQFDLTSYMYGGRGGDRTYIYAGDRHLASYSGSETAFNHTDWLGTMRRATAHDGSVFQNSINANPWGEELYYPNSQGDASLLHFTDKEKDGEDGLDYFGGRYYDPYQPRFMTADWAEKPEAVPYSDLSDPQSLNLYAYVRNNPVSRTDPDGHCLPDCSQAWIGFAKEVVNIFTSNVNFLSKAVAHPDANGRVPQIPQLQPANSLQKSGMQATEAVADVAAVSGTVGLFVAPTPSVAGSLPDDAIVVRGGVPTPEQLTKGAETINQNGTLSGISVNSAKGASVEQLSQGIPNKQVGVSTVGKIRETGANVIKSPKPNNPCHCDMNNVDAGKVSQAFDVRPNPSKVKVPQDQ